VRRDQAVLALYPVALLVLTAIHVLAPQRDGFGALTEVFAPHLFLLTIALVPFALARDASMAFRGALVAVAVVAVLRFGDEWVSIPPEEGRGTPIEVLTWNLELGSDAGKDLVAVLTASRADVVILQELSPDQVRRIEASRALASRFANRVMLPTDDVFGIGLLSTFPIIASEPLQDPSGLTAVLDIGGPDPLTVISAHPLPPRYLFSPGVPPRPTAFDPERRDESLTALRGRIELAMRAAQPLVVLGDFNVTPTEPEYAELAAGLTDVHLAVGVGPGWTWRPRQVEAIPVGILRIDHAFVTGGIRPVGSFTDCSHPGDHCIVSARVVVTPP
jgi:endonuclease/exonuclease/phosphatase family metal-dependent hydrolase